MYGGATGGPSVPNRVRLLRLCPWAAIARRKEPRSAYPCVLRPVAPFPFNIRNPAPARPLRRARAGSFAPNGMEVQLPPAALSNRLEIMSSGDRPFPSAWRRPRSARVDRYPPQRELWLIVGPAPSRTSRG